MIGVDKAVVSYNTAEDQLIQNTGSLDTYQGSRRSIGTFAVKIIPEISSIEYISDNE